MGKYDLTDVAQSPAGVEQDAIASGQRDGEFSKGLRAGTYGAGSQLHSLAGLVGEDLGFGEFAQERGAEAARLQARAQENAPRIGSYKQVDSLRSGVDYATGLVGSSLPVMGAGIAGGLAAGGAGAIPAMMGAAAAMAPFEMGDIVQKQNADPEAMAAPVGSRLRDVAVGGLASAGLQGLVPGLVGRQILGKAAGSVGRQSVKGIVGRNALDIPMEGITEGAGEVIKQYSANQNKATDWDAVTENAIGGAAAGGAFGAAGMSADLARSRAGDALGAASGAIDSARTSIKDRLAAKEIGETGTSAAPKKFNSIVDDLGEMFQRGKAAVSDGVDRVAAGQPLGDMAEFASAQGQKLTDMMDFSDSETVKKATAWGAQMMNDTGLTPERRQAVAEAMQNVADPVARTAMAGMKKTWDAGQAAMGKVQALRESLKRRDVNGDVTEITTPRIGEGDVTDVTPIKKSEDYSGANKAIADKIGPLLAARTDLAEHPEAMAGLADSVRKVIALKTLSSDTVFRLIDTLGADTVPTLEAAYSVVGEDGPVQPEVFYKNLNELADIQSRSSKLQDLIGNSLAEDSQGLIRPDQLGALAQRLVSRARGEGVDPNAGPHQRTAEDRRFRELMAEHFGDKADAVSMAVEKEAGLRTKAEGKAKEGVDEEGDIAMAEEGDFSEEGNRLTAESLDTVTRGRGKTDEPMMHPDLFKANKEPGTNYAAQAMLDLKREYPEHDINFEYAPGSKTHGRAVATKAADPEVLTPADVAGMKLDTKKYPNSTDRIQVGEKILDSRRIARVMDKRLPYSEADQQSRAHRMSRMFKEGIARLIEQNGTFSVPGSVVIGRIGGKDLTVSESRKLSQATSADRESDAVSQQVNELRKRYAQATWPAEKLAKAGLTQAKLNDMQMAALVKEAQMLGSSVDFAKNRELAQEDNPTSPRAEAMKRLESAVPDRETGLRRMKPMDDSSNAAYDADGNLTRDSAMELLSGDYHGGIDLNARSTHERDKTENYQESRGEGRNEIGKDEQIHRVAATLGEGDAMVNKSNMDGSGHSHNMSDRTKEDVGMLVLAVNKWKEGTAKAMGNRADKLLKSFNSMEEADRRTFASLGGVAAKGKQRAIPAASASEAANTINALARKYKDVIVAPVGEVRGTNPPAADGGPGGKNTFTALTAKYSEPSNQKELFPLQPGAERAAKADAPAAAPKTVAPEPTAKPSTGLLEKAIAKRQAYLDNPPQDYSTEVARGHLDWAAGQKERVDAEYEKSKDGDADRQDQLSDLRGALNRLMSKAKKVLEGDASLADKEGTQPPKSVAAKKAALVVRALSGDKALTAELLASDDAKGLQRAAELLAKRAPDSDALKAANDRLAELVQDPDVAYGLQTRAYSAQATSPGTTQTINARANVEAHIEKVLGKSVRLAWGNLTHAGEFQRMRLKDVIRLSVHALDPMSTAHHESLHAFFAQLRDAGATDITRVLEKAASSEHVIAQLEARFANEPAVLAQLKDPEERAAYMYQMWAGDPTFKVSIAAKTVLQKIAEFIRGVLGIWSNDERALHIMEHFNSGEYAKVMGNASAVRAALMAPGRSQAYDAARSMAEPLVRFADAVASTGSARLRESDIPALSDLADLIKREHTDGSGKDQGYISAARIEGAKRRTALGEALQGFTAEQLNEARDALQSGAIAPSPEARLAVRAIKSVLSQTKAYMEAAGIKLGDLGPNYFPRVWDTHYISKHQTEFKDMLEPYVRRGEFKGNVDDFIKQLTVREGNEFGIESRMPGMQFKKERLLSFITSQDASMFVTKDLFGTLGSYINQATRRAEWNRRLGEGKLEALFDRAKNEGATPEQLKLADNYLKGVDGTLGDSLNPHARRLMGNMIVYQNVRLLPLAVFSSIVDPVGVMVRGGDMKDAWNTFKRGMSEIPESFGRKASSDEGAKMAELVGVIDSAVMADTLGDMYTQGMVGGTAQKINTAFFKYNMMEGLNRSFRIGASEAAVRFMARHADGTSSTHSKRWINELGLQAGDVKAVPGGGIALTAADGLSDAQVIRVHAAINQWVDGAVLRPDAADKPLWMNDPHYALISHLKQFVYSFQKTIIERVVHETKNGNYTPAMALAGYVPVMLAADFAKGMLQGGGDQPEWKKGWDLGDYVSYAVQRAGLLGVGQFGADAAQDVQRGGSGFGALTGPTIEQFSDAVQLMGGHKEFGPMLLKAMPANALYAHTLGGADGPTPVHAE